jgi:hypothetical protein
MQFMGQKSVAANDEAVVLVVSGERSDAIRVWALPRSEAAG